MFERTRAIVSVILVLFILLCSCSPDAGDNVVDISVHSAGESSMPAPGTEADGSDGDTGTDDGNGTDKDKYPGQNTDSDGEGSTPGGTGSDTTSEDQTPPVPVIPENDPHIDEKLATALGAMKKVVVYSPGEGLLYSKGDPNERIYPASISKLVTALTALQYVTPETVCTAGEELDLVQRDASVAMIFKGQKLTVDMLIGGMLLPSGCDAAYVLAANVGKICRPDCKNDAQAVEVFLDLMKKWSKDNGLTNSVWGNPDGYHSDGLYTCIRDLMIVAEKSLENDIIRKYCSMVSMDAKYVSGETIRWVNTNMLIDPVSDYYNPYCIGLKTGMTDAAGNCLLTAFEKNGKRYYIGVFGCDSHEERFSGTNFLFSYFSATVGNMN